MTEAPNRPSTIDPLSYEGRTTVRQEPLPWIPRAEMEKMQRLVQVMVFVGGVALVAMGSIELVLLVAVGYLLGRA